MARSLATEYRFMRMPEVVATVGLCRGQIYNMIRDGSFPAQLKIGRASLWRSDEIEKWMESVQNGL